MTEVRTFVMLTWCRSVSTVSNPENLYTSRSQMAAEQNYKRLVMSSV